MFGCYPLLRSSSCCCCWPAAVGQQAKTRDNNIRLICFCQASVFTDSNVQQSGFLQEAKISRARTQVATSYSSKRYIKFHGLPFPLLFQTFNPLFFLKKNSETQLTSSRKLRLRRSSNPFCSAPSNDRFLPNCVENFGSFMGSPLENRTAVSSFLSKLIR